MICMNGSSGRQRILLRSVLIVFLSPPSLLFAAPPPVPVSVTPSALVPLAPQAHLIPLPVLSPPFSVTRPSVLPPASFHVPSFDYRSISANLPPLRSAITMNAMALEARRKDFFNAAGPTIDKFNEGKPMDKQIFVSTNIAGLELTQGGTVTVTDLERLYRRANFPGRPIGTPLSDDEARAMATFIRNTTKAQSEYRKAWERSVAKAAPSEPVTEGIRNSITSLHEAIRDVYDEHDLAAIRALPDARDRADALLAREAAYARVMHRYGQGTDVDPMFGQFGDTLAKQLGAYGLGITYYQAPASREGRDVLIVNLNRESFNYRHTMWLSDYIRAGYPRDF